MYPIVATTLTRAAALAGSSAAALMPTGKPRDAPSPQTITPTTTSAGWSPYTTSSRPSTADAAVVSSTGTRPNRSSSTVPATLPVVMEVTNSAKPATPSQSGAP